MKKIICFGELMFRLNPPGYERITQTDTLELNYGGAEANVAVALSNMGMNTAFVSRLPDSETGQAAVNALRRYGVDTDMVVRGGDRVGIYYVEKGAAQRSSKVIYDRKYSSIATASREDFDWDKIFANASWFHVTGITPALGDNVAEITLDALKAARKAGIPVSCDPNYRKNLWTLEKAGAVLSNMLPYVDLFIGNEDTADKLFGIGADEVNEDDRILSNEAYIRIARRICERFGCRMATLTVRRSHTADNNDFCGMIYDRLTGDSAFSDVYKIQNIVDRVGGGDAYGAGIIYGLLNNKGLKYTVDFATASAVLKHSIEGDFSLVVTHEIEDLMKHGGSGRIVR